MSYVTSGQLKQFAKDVREQIDKATPEEKHLYLHQINLAYRRNAGTPQTNMSINMNIYNDSPTQLGESDIKTFLQQYSNTNPYPVSGWICGLPQTQDYEGYLEIVTGMYATDQSYKSICLAFRIDGNYQGQTEIRDDGNSFTNTTVTVIDTVVQLI